MKTAVIINQYSGSSTCADNDVTVEAIRKAFDRQGVESRITAVTGSDLTAAAQQAVRDGYDRVVAGGGDGTLGAVASVVAGTSVSLGILPLGTLNHFARDAGIPTALDDAVDVVVNGVPHRIDVAEVNGRIFLNNSSLGLYPHLVRRREGMSERLGIGKWSAMALAFLNVVGSFPLYTVDIETGGRRQHTTTPMVFIGNNRYTMDLFRLGVRERLDEGKLSLYIARCSGRFCLLRFALRALFGRLNQSKHFESLSVDQVRIGTRRGSIRVALDGEVVRLSPPLQYRIRTRDLIVMMPPAQQVNDGS